MDAVKERLYQVFFGGSYRECWDSDYTLSIAYEGRRMVLARKKNEVWVPVDGDAELCELLRSSDCPPLSRQYFQAAASISAAAELCVRRGLPLDRIWEFYHEEDNPLAAPELMRLLMDDGGLTLNEAYQVTARCCENLACFGAEVGQVYPLQPRTAHVISLLRGCWTSVLAVEHNVLEPTYRNPIGAVTEGTRVQFSLRKLGGRAERATLILTGDKFYRQYPMAEIGDRFVHRVQRNRKFFGFLFLTHNRIRHNALREERHVNFTLADNRSGGRIAVEERFAEFLAGETVVHEKVRSGNRRDYLTVDARRKEITFAAIDRPKGYAGLRVKRLETAALRRNEQSSVLQRRAGNLFLTAHHGRLRKPSASHSDGIRVRLGNKLGRRVGKGRGAERAHTKKDNTNREMPFHSIKPFGSRSHALS